MGANGRMMGRLDSKSVLLLRMCFVGTRFERREIPTCHLCGSLCRCDKNLLSCEIILFGCGHTIRIYLTLKECNLCVLPKGHMLWMLATKSSKIIGSGKQHKTNNNNNTVDRQQCLGWSSSLVKLRRQIDFL